MNSHRWDEVSEGLRNIAQVLWVTGFVQKKGNFEVNSGSPVNLTGMQDKVSENEWENTRPPQFPYKQSKIKPAWTKNKWVNSLRNAEHIN